MQSTRLKQLITEPDIDKVSGRELYNSLSVTSISTDSRSLKKGDIFIAIPGESFDGHSFINEAIKKGAAAVVFETGRRTAVDRFIKKNRPALFIGVSDTRKAFGTLAKNYLSRFDIRKIVVTGSCGKTMTRGLLSSVLSRRYKVVSSRKSYNNDIGVPKTILEIDGSTDVLVQELGTNRSGEIEYLSSIVEQDYALITNIGPAHIGFFGSEMNIAREKKAALLRLKKGGVAFLNAEDPYFDFLSDGIKAGVKSFGLEKGDLFARPPIRHMLDRTEFTLQGVGMSVGIAGMHGVINAVGAALVGLHFGCALEEIKRGIEDYEGEGGRGNLHTSNGVTVIDESYNANPLSVRVALESLARVEVRGRKAFVFADMLELGDKAEQFHLDIADYVAGTGIDALFTYGRLSGITASRCEEIGLEGIFQFSEIEELIQKLKGWVRDGDLVLIKGSRAMRLERVLDMFLS